MYVHVRPSCQLLGMCTVCECVKMCLVFLVMYIYAVDVGITFEILSKFFIELALSILDMFIIILYQERENLIS
jgi:hypothetical protein